MKFVEEFTMLGLRNFMGLFCVKMSFGFMKKAVFIIAFPILNLSIFPFRSHTSMVMNLVNGMQMKQIKSWKILWKELEKLWK